jgi:hypothetical protein
MPGVTEENHENVRQDNKSPSQDSKPKHLTHYINMFREIVFYNNNRDSAQCASLVFTELN